MISFENTEVFNFEGAIRGMRNPLNSWNKSDSEFWHDPTCGNTSDCIKCEERFKTCGCSYIGENDLDLMKRLIKAGPDHRKFMRQIFVVVHITAPLYWWKEFDTYKVGTVSNSCSTMHKIQAKEFTLDDFSYEHLSDEIISPLGTSVSVLENTIDLLNYYRDKFIETKEKTYWWQMIQLLPSSYNQKRTITLNYEVLRNIYKSR